MTRLAIAIAATALVLHLTADLGARVAATVGQAEIERAMR